MQRYLALINCDIFVIFFHSFSFSFYLLGIRFKVFCYCESQYLLSNLLVHVIEDHWCDIPLHFGSYQGTPSFSQQPLCLSLGSTIHELFLVGGVSLLPYQLFCLELCGMLRKLLQIWIKLVEGWLCKFGHLAQLTGVGRAIRIKIFRFFSAWHGLKGVSFGWMRIWLTNSTFLPLKVVTGLVFNNSLDLLLNFQEIELSSPA